MLAESLQTIRESGRLIFRSPTANDSSAVHKLLQRCMGMDANSRQCYLILCEHFASTCVVAEQGDNIVAFISAYVLPERHDTLFIWQIVVDKGLRGRGIAKKLLRHLLSRPNLKRMRYVEAMLNPSNKAAQPLFRALAKECKCSIDEMMTFPADLFGEENRDQGNLIRVGPIDSVSKTLIGRR
jgi:L-2,4-diaminobutyric acid acetyltransferase